MHVFQLTAILMDEARSGCRRVKRNKPVKQCFLIRTVRTELQDASSQAREPLPVQREPALHRPPKRRQSPCRNALTRPTAASELQCQAIHIRIVSYPATGSAQPFAFHRRQQFQRRRMAQVYPILQERHSLKVVVIQGNRAEALVGR